MRWKMSITSSKIPPGVEHRRAFVRDAECALSQSVRRVIAFPTRRNRVLSPPRPRDVSRCVLMNPHDISNNNYSGTVSYDGAEAPTVGEDLGWSTSFLEQFAISHLLGQGSFGLVHEGVDLRSGAPVAVKVMPKFRSNLPRSRGLERIAREIDIMQRLQACSSVVRLEGCFEDKEDVQIVMEKCSGGDLHKYVEAHGPLDERNLAVVAVEILKIIGACHKLGIFHGDVKPANFCVKDVNSNPLVNGGQLHSLDPWLKALDFGCSQNVKGSERLCKRSGTPIYMAPEIYARDYGHAADMWSFGMTLYWLFAGRFPFFACATTVRAAKLDDVIKAVNEDPIPMDYGSWLGMSEDGRDFISKCFERDEKARMTVSDALEHPWLHEAVQAAGPMNCL